MVNVGKPLLFNASDSTDNVGIISYEWDFGGGAIGTGIICYHTYTKSGTYTVTLTVKDVAGSIGINQITVTVFPNKEFPLLIVGVVAVVVIGTAFAAVFL